MENPNKEAKIIGLLPKRSDNPPKIGEKKNCIMA
jgi:hypothetical protein